MKNTDLLQYIGEIDDKYIAECDRAMTSKPTAYRWSISQWRRAAVLLTVLLVFFTSVITVEALRLNRPILRYEKQDRNWYVFQADTSALEDPYPGELETVHIPATLPEKFHLTSEIPGRRADEYGHFTILSSMRRKWEAWNGDSVSLYQSVLANGYRRVQSGGTWTQVQVGEAIGYRSQWAQNDVLVWATNEYMYVLQLEGESAVALDAITLAGSLVPEDSLQKPDDEKEYKDINLTFDPKWNYQTVCRNACLEEGRIRFNPAFLAEVPEAAQYEGKYGAISVWTADNPDGPQELWILWEDYTITYLHMTEEAYREKYQHSKEPDLFMTDISGQEGDRWYYVVKEEWKAREEHLLRWRCWDALLKNRKAAWLVGNGPTSNGSYGMLTTDGAMIFFPTPTYAIEKFTGKPDAAHNSKTEYVVLWPPAGEYFVASGGQNRVQMRHGVEEVRRFWSEWLEEYQLQQDTVWYNAWPDNKQVVQAADDLILRSDGRLIIKSGIESQKCYRATDEQCVRIFPEAGYGLTVDNRLIRYAEFVDGPDEIRLKEGGEVDQVTQELVVVYKDGSVQYPADMTEMAWMADVKQVRTASSIRLPVGSLEIKTETAPIPESAS